jgi:hypothetical protein
MEATMRLSKPKNVTFYFAVLLAVLGLIGAIASVGFISTYAFWFVLVAFIVLALGNLIDGF